jgi:hypothetical protein
MNKHLMPLFLLWLLADCLPASTAEPPRRIMGWNAYSIQFIDPPEFTLLAIPRTTVFRAVVEQGGRSWQVDSARPQVSLASVWGQIQTGKFALTLAWRDQEGTVITWEQSVRVKAPDWAGFHEPPEDWVAAADRNIAYLIRAASEEQVAYREPGVPAWIWCSAPPGHDAGFPCLNIPQAIWGLLAHVQANRPQHKEALRLACVNADWALKNRLPDAGALPLVPFSTISRGKFSGGAEGESVNLMRASWMGLSMVDLYRVTQNAAYLEYAKHIAQVTARFQRPDGSFPYRVNPKTGVVTESYAPVAIEFAVLVEALEPFQVDEKLLMAAHRAVQWMNAYVAGTGHWQGAYEDVGEQPPYANLSQMETQWLVAYLCRQKDRDPAYLPLARRLNRWIEDQFVIFGPESEAFKHPVKGPLVFEQFACWAPMEGHTAFWIASLIELHKATWEQVYLDKAKGAGNAICSQPFSDGVFSTWGARKFVDGRMTGNNRGENWYNANFRACVALCQLDAYVRSLGDRSKR